MIFYFSGTGNSKHVAEKIAENTKDRLVPITSAIMRKGKVYQVREDEKIGFIFPVYWYCIPTIVEKFINGLVMEGYQKQYVYGIATYGIAGGNVMNRLSKVLVKKEIKLDGQYGIKMVDNYVVGYNMADKDKQDAILKEADNEIDKIIEMIHINQRKPYIRKGILAFVSPITGYAYRNNKHTRKFFITETCNGCGHCERACPCEVIHMAEGRPSWKGECTFCLKCIHECKQSAIQHNKHMENRRKYQYPMKGNPT